MVPFTKGEPCKDRIVTCGAPVGVSLPAPGVAQRIDQESHVIDKYDTGNPGD